MEMQKRGNRGEIGQVKETEAGMKGAPVGWVEVYIFHFLI